MTGNRKPNPAKAVSKRTDAFSLVEVIISMFILTVMAGSIIYGLTHAKYTAQDNYYEGAAFTIALGTLEQMKGGNLYYLENPQEDGDGDEIFQIMIGESANHDLKLGQFNEIEVASTTTADGATVNNFKIRLKPSITPSAVTPGYWLEVVYEWKHPRSGKVRTRTIRNMRSTVTNVS